MKDKGIIFAGALTLAIVVMGVLIYDASTTDIGEVPSGLNGEMNTEIGEDNTETGEEAAQSTLDATTEFSDKERFVEDSEAQLEILRIRVAEIDDYQLQQTAEAELAALEGDLERIRGASASEWETVKANFLASYDSLTEKIPHSVAE